MRTRTLFILALALLAGACSLPLKQKAVLSLQASETALEGAHDAERGICFAAPATEAGTHCTSPLAAAVGLTDERHQRAAVLFSDAFGYEIQAAAVLQAWRAGDPPPASFADYQRATAQILALAQQLIPADQAQAKNFVAKIQAAVDAAAQVGAVIGVHP